MNPAYEWVGIVGQWLAVLMVSVGLIVEVATGANLGFVIITAGSLIFAIATKIKYRRH